MPIKKPKPGKGGKKSAVDEFIEALIRFLKKLFGINQRLIEKLRKKADEFEDLGKNLKEKAKDMSGKDKEDQIRLGEEFLEKAKKLREEADKLLSSRKAIDPFGEYGAGLLASLDAEIVLGNSLLADAVRFARTSTRSRARRRG